MNDLEEKKLNLQERIDELLKTKKIDRDFLDSRTMDEILEDIGIYHQELEYQNVELTRIREDLEISKSHYQDLFENAPLGYVLFDEDYYILSANNYFKKLTGYEFLSDSKTSITEYIDHESQDMFYFHVKNLIDENKTHAIQLRLKNEGKSVAVKFESKLTKDSDKKVIRSAILDIDNEKRLESVLINEKEKAQAANLAKSQFVLNMSHEIRTPMNGILGFADLLAFTSIDEEQKEYVDCIKGSGKDLLNVISNILEVSKVQAGDVLLEKNSFDIRTLVQKTVNGVSAVAAKKGIDINVLINSSVPNVVKGDYERLKQVLSNLVNNAVKFTKEGDVLIEVRVLSKTNKFYDLEFRVVDKGIGVDVEDLNKIFEPFVGVDNSSTREFDGAGLGLSISKCIVEKMGGSLLVENNKEKGATFKFNVILENNQVEDFACGVDKMSIKGQRVLIVDGFLQESYITKVYLEEAGCMVRVVGSLEDVLDRQKCGEVNLKFNVVLVDRRIVSRSGKDVVESLKQNIETKDADILLLGFQEAQEELIKLSLNGFAGFVTKDCKKSELISEIRMIQQGQVHMSGKREILIKEKVGDGKKSAFNILLVEDEKDHIIFFIKLLKLKGFHCDVAINGEDALNAIREKDYDLIFMDCHMPVLNGYDTARRIRDFEKKLNKHTPIVAVTACALKGDDDKCLETGMDDYVSKPVDVELLSSKIEKYLGVK